MYRIEEMRFHLVRCPCGMVYVDPRPDAETIARMYEDLDYYAEGYTCGVQTHGYFERREDYFADNDRKIARIEKETGRTGGDLFELGVAGGFFLEAARRRGWNVKGVEISPPAAEYAREEFDLDIHLGRLATAPYEDASFDVAVAEHVIEHTTRPDEVLARMRRLLRPGGHLVVIVPSYVNSVFFRGFSLFHRRVPRRVLGDRLWRILKFEPEFDGGGGLGYPYHILEFDRKSLSRLVREAGFEIVSCEGFLALPAHLRTSAAGSVMGKLRDASLRQVFRALNGAMGVGLLPGAILRILARVR
jgi:SAM-dependent methyltransferase